MTRTKFLLTSLAVGIILLSLLTTLGFATYLKFSHELGSPQEIVSNNNQGVILIDRHSKPFFTLYDAHKIDYLPAWQIPSKVQQAAIASEDKDFYYHNGFSLKSIFRSIVNNIKTHSDNFGGSTITQQLVKNTLLSPKKSLIRKFQEVILAEQLEKRYTKSQILEMYLNSTYYGNGAYGISNAAKKFFNKQVNQLNLAETAFLIGMLPEPSKSSPTNGSLDLAHKHQRLVLQKMFEQGFISRNDYFEALNYPLHFDSEDQQLNIFAPHFALMVRDQLKRQYGEEKLAKSGIVVKTTLDFEQQKYAEKVVKNQVELLNRNLASNGAAVVIDPKTGEVLSLVGSKDWTENNFGKVNITTSLRQPGSAFKPLVYATALEKRLITVSTMLKDAPITYKPQFGASYSPKNYDGKFRGRVTTRRALANSLNVPSVEVMNKVGVSEVLSYAKQFGITSLGDENRFWLSLVLGSGEVQLLELTSAYGVFANNGVLMSPYLIDTITDKQGKIIYRHGLKPKTVISPETAFLISSILSDSSARQEVFGISLNTSRRAAVKTGTTENYRDAWTLGYTPSLVVGVWVGNNDGQQMDNVAGSLGAAPIWRQLMEKYLANTPPETFQPPANIVQVPVCTSNNKDKPQTYQEYFIKGTEPASSCKALASNEPIKV